MLYNLQKSGAKTFLLTNSGWEYTNQVLMKLGSCLFNFHATLGISNDPDLTYLSTCLVGHGLPVELP